MTSFLVFGLSIGLGLLVYGVVLLLIAAFQEHVNNMEQGHGHIGGIGLQQPAGNLWAARVQRQVSALGTRIRSYVAAVSASKRTVYVDQLYEQHHPRIAAINKAIHGKVTR